MILRRTTAGLELRTARGWVPVTAAAARLASFDMAATADVIALLALPRDERDRLADAATELEPTGEGAGPRLPFAPLSFRDFMLYEAHAVEAARGFVQRYMPAANHLMRTYEKMTRRTFPPLRPQRIWYDMPIYYFGNHLTFAADGEDVEAPGYSDGLDYELELGFVLAHPLLDADADVAEQAIGGFVVLNDFSARDVQLAEMRSGFGPQKAKHFRSAMAAEIVSADEILPHWERLSGRVRINGEIVAECSTAGPRWSLGEVLAHASRGEQLHPGELFGTGTLPSGSGIENGRLLIPGDRVELAIDGIGSIANRIV